MTVTYNVHNCAAWASSTAYSVGARRKNGSSPVRAYQCTVAGTSASSGGPTGTGDAIVDGGVTWRHLSVVDYTTFASAFSGMGTLTDATELHIWNDAEWTESLEPSGNSPTAVNTLLIRPAPGEGFADSFAATAYPLRYDVTKGVGIKTTSNYVTPISFMQGYTTVKGVQAYSLAKHIVYGGSSGSGICIDGCLLDASGTTSTDGRAIYRWVGSAALTVRNSVLIVRNATQAAWGFFGMQFYNCTFVRVALVAATGHAVQYNYTAGAMRNCAAFGFSSVIGSGPGSTSVTCATDQASPPSGWTGSLSYSAQFENTGTVQADRDFRMKAGAGLIDIGTTDSAYIPGSVDIFGASRPGGAAWDIGAQELPPSGRMFLASLMNGLGSGGMFHRHALG